MNQTGNTKGRAPKPKALAYSELDDLKPPSWFTAEARAAFNTLKPHVISVAKDEDVPLFFTMCVAYGLVVEAAKDIKKNGVTILDEKKIRRKNPATTTFRENTLLFNALTVKFGMSPVDRARMINATPSVKDEIDLLEQLIGGE